MMLTRGAAELVNKVVRGLDRQGASRSNVKAASSTLDMKQP
jgi:hypothetical protein